MCKLKFFFYGTLKVGGRFTHALPVKRLSTKSATCNGIMYSVNDTYPAVVFDEKAERIIGEIHEYENEKVAHKFFDTIEGFIAENKAYNLFNRKVIIATDNEGNKIECQAYEYNRAITYLSKIDSGYWPVKGQIIGM